MIREEYQEKIIIEKYNMMIESCPYYPNCLPECNGMEMCNHIIDRTKQIDKRIGDKIMNARQRKKYLDMGAECGHRHYGYFMITDDPYPIYDEVDKCKLGKFHVRHGYSDCCFSCKHYTLSKKSMGEAMERVKDHKLYLKECKKIYP